MLVAGARGGAAIGVLVHEAEGDEAIDGQPRRAHAAEGPQRGVRPILEQANARQALRGGTALGAGEARAQRPRLGEVSGSRLARDIGHEIVERARPIAARGAREGPREPRLLDVERDGAVDPRARERVDGGVLRRALPDVLGARVLRAPARARDAAHARDERPEPGAVVPQRRHGRLGHGALERVGRDGGRDVRGGIGERLIEEIAAEARGVADVDPLLGLLEEGARVIRGARGARRGRRGREAGAAVRELRPQRAQIGPRGLERERIAQRLVGAIRLERAALAREQAAEGAPRVGVGGREVDGDLELPGRLVDAPERLERAPAQEARALPRRMLVRERVEGGQRLLGAAGRERAAPPRRRVPSPPDPPRAKATPRARARARRASRRRADRGLACAARA